MEQIEKEKKDHSTKSVWFETRALNNMKCTRNQRVICWTCNSGQSVGVGIEVFDVVTVAAVKQLDILIFKVHRQRFCPLDVDVGGQNYKKLGKTSTILVT